MYKFNNIWGAKSGVNQQRADLFKVALTIPSAVIDNGASAWNSECAFAVSRFPFPPRAREMIGIKFLNQTNFSLGADTPMSPIDIQVRYAFDAKTAEYLEKWSWATSNPRSGYVANTTEIKTNGKFYWLIPDKNNSRNSTSCYKLGACYIIEGCLVKGYHPVTDANMEESNGLVNLAFQLQIDRYYPDNTADLTQTPGTFSPGTFSL